MTKDALKSLEHYAANPDDMPTDPEALEALMAQLAGDGGAADLPVSDKQPKDSATGGAEENGSTIDPAAESGGAADQAGQTQDDESATIASKDGKHPIPYSVLTSERKRRQSAEQRVGGLEAQVEELNRKLAAQVKEARGSTTGEEQSDDGLAQMAEEFPAIKALLSRSQKLEAQLREVAQQVEADTVRQAESARDAVQAAVDTNPALRHWQQTDPDRWQAAIEADTRLQKSPAHRGLSLEDRLARAVDVVDAFYGNDDSIPQTGAPSKDEGRQGKPETPSTKPPAASKPQAPRTLSDIPGGAVPATDPLESFANLSAEALGEKMANMTTDQINVLLSRLG